MEIDNVFVDWGTWSREHQKQQHVVRSHVCLQEYRAATKEHGFEIINIKSIGKGRWWCIMGRNYVSNCVISEPVVQTEVKMSERQMELL